MPTDIDNPPNSIVARKRGGVPGEEPEQAFEVPKKCPRCGSTDLVVGRYMAGVTTGIDVICGNCNWQGMIQPGIW